MNRRFLVVLLVFSLTSFAGVKAIAQNQEKEKSTEELAAEEAGRLELMLKLEPHQVFFVDSILQHDMKAMKEEFEQMQRSGMVENSSYEIVRERWLKQIRNSYEKVFTPAQWEKYLKSVGLYKKEKKKKNAKK